MLCFNVNIIYSRNRKKHALLLFNILPSGLDFTDHSDVQRTLLPDICSCTKITILAVVITSTPH